MSIAQYRVDSEPLYEKYRPRCFADVLGQPKAVKTLERMRARTGFGGRAFWLSGPTGTGKTALARIVARFVAEPPWILEYHSADLFTPTEATLLSQESRFYGGGNLGGRAWIINEAHGLRAPVIRQLLGVLEPDGGFPSHCVVIFTTTWDGQDKLSEDQIDARPLLSRCHQLKLTNQGLAPVFAEALRRGAEAEDLNGRPLADYVKLVKTCHNNMREAWQAVENGAMLED